MACRVGARAILCKTRDILVWVPVPEQNSSDRQSQRITCGAKGLVRWGLGPPSQSCEIRILPFWSVAPRSFFGLTECSPGLFLLALQLESLFAVAFG